MFWKKFVNFLKRLFCFKVVPEIIQEVASELIELEKSKNG